MEYDDNMALKLGPRPQVMVIFVTILMLAPGGLAGETCVLHGPPQSLAEVFAP
jgi:hypothetical protein